MTVDSLDKLLGEAAEETKKPWPDLGISDELSAEQHLILRLADAVRALREDLRVADRQFTQLKESSGKADAEVIKLREANRKLHRRAQGSEAVAMSKPGNAFLQDQVDRVLATLDAAGAEGGVRGLVAERDRALETLKEARADAFDEGRSAVIEYAMGHVVDEPDELAGFIDQHVVAVGGAKLRNPYREDES